MSKALIEQTQVNACLTLTIVAKNDNDTQFVTLPILELTTLLFWLWSFWETVSRLWLDLTELVNAMGELLEAAQMVIKIYQMWGSVFISSLRYGIGV